MRKLIRTDGTTQEFDKPLSLSEIERLIGCEGTDSIMPKDRIHVMCIDDWGATKGLPVNAQATKLYYEKCGGAVDWFIHGNVVIVPDRDFAGG